MGTNLTCPSSKEEVDWVQGTSVDFPVRDNGMSLDLNSVTFQSIWELPNIDSRTSINTHFVVNSTSNFCLSPTPGLKYHFVSSQFQFNNVILFSTRLLKSFIQSDNVEHAIECSNTVNTT